MFSTTKAQNTGTRGGGLFVHRPDWKRKFRQKYKSKKHSVFFTRSEEKPINQLPHWELYPGIYLWIHWELNTCIQIQLFGCQMWEADIHEVQAAVQSLNLSLTLSQPKSTMSYESDCVTYLLPKLNNAPYLLFMNLSLLQFFCATTRSCATSITHKLQAHLKLKGSPTGLPASQDQHD